MSDLLHVEGISLSFGGLKAVQNFHLRLKKDSLDGLIGPNGAGKTTVFNLLTGVYPPEEGRILLNGRAIQGARPYQIAKHGIARTFQNIRLFSQMSVLDNVRVGFHLRSRQSLWSAFLHLTQARQEEAQMHERAMVLLQQFRLDQRAHEEAGSLSYGDQRRLEIARALATEPQVLLLDEPAAGMNPQEKRALCDLIQKIREQYRLAILLIEHDMGVVMEICQQITVLDHGETIATGGPAVIQKDPKVIEAYLGEAQ